MKKSAFVARTPLEVGDVVSVSYFGEGVFVGCAEVIDILAIHSAATDAVRFRYVIRPTDEAGPTFTVGIDSIKSRVVDDREIPIGAEASREYSEYRTA